MSLSATRGAAGKPPQATSALVWLESQDIPQGWRMCGVAALAGSARFHHRRLYGFGRTTSHKGGGSLCSRFEKRRKLILSCADSAQGWLKPHILVNPWLQRGKASRKFSQKILRHADSLAQSKAMVVSPATASILPVFDKISHLLHLAQRAQEPDFPLDSPILRSR